MRYVNVGLSLAQGAADLLPGQMQSLRTVEVSPALTSYFPHVKPSSPIVQLKHGLEEKNHIDERLQPAHASVLSAKSL